jgi:hypothetical protein
LPSPSLFFSLSLPCVCGLGGLGWGVLGVVTGRQLLYTLRTPFLWVDTEDEMRWEGRKAGAVASGDKCSGAPQNQQEQGSIVVVCLSVCLSVLSVCSRRLSLSKMGGRGGSSGNGGGGGGGGRPTKCAGVVVDVKESYLEGWKEGRGDSNNKKGEKRARFI